MVKFTEELGNSKERVRPEKVVHVEIVVVQCTWQLFMMVQPTRRDQE